MSMNDDQLATLTAMRDAVKSTTFIPPTTDPDAKCHFKILTGTAASIHNQLIGRCGLRINGRLRKKHGIPPKQYPEPRFRNWGMS